MFVNLITANHDKSTYWCHVFSVLHSDSPYSNYDSQFYQWLETEWGITVITNLDDYEGYIAGVEVTDQAYLMILLRFPLTNDI